MLLKRQKSWMSAGLRLNGVLPRLSGAYPQCLFEFQNPHLAVACLPGSGHVANRLHHLLRNRIVLRKLDFGLRQEVDSIFGPAINLRVPALATVSVDRGYRNALDADISHGLPHPI